MIDSTNANILHNARTVGRARLKQLYAHPALYPSIQMNLGVILTNLPEHPSLPGGAVRNIEIRGIEGELRMNQTSDAIGPVRWVDGGSAVRSSDNAAEWDIRLVCDLDPYRVEQIEIKRNGTAPTFWLQLWPTALHEGRPTEISFDNLRFQISLETWGSTLQSFGYGSCEFIEVRFKAPAKDAARKALDCVAAARQHRDRGAYDSAAADCRMALEALQNALGLPEKASKSDWKAVLSFGTKERTASEFVDVLTAFRGVTHLAHHFKPNDDDTFRPDFSRTEIGFIIRMTEEFISLVTLLRQS